MRQRIEVPDRRECWRHILGWFTWMKQCEIEPKRVAVSFDVFFSLVNDLGGVFVTSTLTTVSGRLFGMDFAIDASLVGREAYIYDGAANG